MGGRGNIRERVRIGGWLAALMAAVPTVEITRATPGIGIHVLTSKVERKQRRRENYEL